MLNKKEPLEIIKRIYEGNIEFDDKPFVNTECDKIYMEIEEVRKKNISNEVLFQKFDTTVLQQPSGEYCQKSMCPSCLKYFMGRMEQSCWNESIIISLTFIFSGRMLLM